MIYNQFGGNYAIRNIWEGVCDECESYKEVVKLFYEILIRDPSWMWNKSGKEPYNRWRTRYINNNPGLCHCNSCMNLAWYRTLPCSNFKSGNCRQCNICYAKQTDEFFKDECPFRADY
jgi:hypothetical protein